MVDGCVCAELPRTGELVVAQDDVTIAFAPSAFAIWKNPRRDAAADPPEKHPLVRLDPHLRHHHQVGGLEASGKAAAFLEAQVVGDRMDVLLGDWNELGVRAVHVLAHDGDPPVAMMKAGVDDDALAVVEGAGAVGADSA